MSGRRDKENDWQEAVASASDSLQYYSLQELLAMQEANKALADQDPVMLAALQGVIGERLAEAPVYDD
ncbi:MAG: hypothetical protein II085_04615 [Alphaproteobacteria bacterium]|nr:hypothetical protein [Alphaproteobacteria bacterium]